jgi:hypothetical protein
MPAQDFTPSKVRNLLRIKNKQDKPG